jgi:predicted transposase YbfD/YdcC
VKHIILEAMTTEAVVFDVGKLATYLGRLHDSRDPRGKVYPLGVILTLVVLAKLAGEDKMSGIAEWIRLRREAFVGLFNLKHRRMPCLNVIRRVLQEVVVAEELEAALQRYLHDSYGGQESRLIAIDGKTMRGTVPKGRTQGVHLLAAYLPAEGVVLKQVAVAAKENEVVAAPALVAGLDLKNKVVCGDALHTQRHLSAAILAAGGHYLWFVKDNQPTLLADVVQFFQPPQKSAGWPLPPLAHTVAQTTEKNHGRLTKRVLTLVADREAFLDWPGIRQVIRLERHVLHLHSGQQTTDVAYAITSCGPVQASADQLLAWTRHYWGIENGLHYRRDVTLREDALRIGQPTLARAVAGINNFLIGLSCKLGYTNLASARRRFNARIAAQLSLA